MTTLAVLLIAISAFAAPRNYELKSPDGRLRVNVEAGEGISYTLTHGEDLLLDKEEQEAVYIMRRALNGMKSDEAVENILNMFVKTKDNRELTAKVRRQKFI